MRRALLLPIVIGLCACQGGTSTMPSPAGVVGASSPLQQNSVAPLSFYRDYTGPRRPALSALAAGGVFFSQTQTIAFYAKMNGPVLDGNINTYVIGIQRGAAVNHPFPDEPNVNFDAVVIVTSDPVAGALRATVTALGPGAAARPLAAPVLAAPDTFIVSVPAELLPSTGLTPDHYTWNLWPRSGLGGTPAAQIASFIPDDAMSTLIQQ